MGERIQGIWTRVRETVGKWPKGVKRGIVIGLVLVVALIVALNIYTATRPYVVLFTELNQDDMTRVVTYLTNAGVTDYQIVNDDTILVKEGQEAGLKAAIYQEGLTSSGFGYGTYLSNVGILTSESDRQTLQLYELMDRLSATVKQMDGVKDAHVNISQGTTTSYLLSDNTISATASVQVTMETGRVLTTGEVAAIQYAISHAVSGLEIENIDIFDTAGNNYTTVGASASLTDAAETKMGLEAQINESTRLKVLELLAPMYGVDNLAVSVNSTVDTSHTYSEVLRYIEPEWAEDGSAGGQGIIGKWIWDSGLVRGDNETAGGVVGTTTNADINEYVINEGTLDGTETEIGTSGERDYLVSTERTQSENQGGVVTDLMVAVAINSNVVEISESQAAQLVPTVARAAGISPEDEASKIAIIRAPFYVGPTPEPPGEKESWLSGWWPFPEWMFYAAAGGVLLFLIALVSIILIRRRAKRKREAAAAQQPIIQYVQAEAAPPEEGADIMEMNTDRTMELRQNVRNFAEVNPAIAAQMVKSWLRGGEGNG